MAVMYGSITEVSLRSGAPTSGDVNINIDFPFKS